MHEFSLATEVIRIVNREAEKKTAATINEMTIEVGDLSGVDAEAFKAALEILTYNTRFAGTCINILREKGTGKCNACNIEFEMDQMISACPQCQCFPSEIKGGREIRLVSVTME